MQRGPKHAVISWPKEESALYESLKIRYLAVLPFDSSRKMMSVLIENQKRDGGSVLLTKGADSAIFARLKNGENFSNVHSATLTHVDNYAVEGLRNGLIMNILLLIERFLSRPGSTYRANISLQNATKFEK